MHTELIKADTGKPLTTDHTSLIPEPQTGNTMSAEDNLKTTEDGFSAVAAVAPPPPPLATAVALGATTTAASTAGSSNTTQQHQEHLQHELSDHDIILGRHKVALTHPGNLRFHQVIEKYLEPYKLSLDNKARKSQLLADISRDIDQTLPGGRFVKLVQVMTSTTTTDLLSKQNQVTKKVWQPVSKSVARERISQGLRDGLKDYYKSSLSHKKKRRLVQKGEMTPDDPALQIVGARMEDETNAEPDNTMQSTAAGGNANKRRKTDSEQVEEPNSVEVRQEGNEGPVITDIPAYTTAEDDKQIIQIPPPQVQPPKAEDPVPGVAITTAAAVSNPGQEQVLLPKDGIAWLDESFEPQANDIVVGLRKRSATHPGYVCLFCCCQLKDEMVFRILY